MAEEVLSSLSMRATITVEGELAERIERLSQERATSFEDLANAALLEGLEHLAAEKSKAEGAVRKRSAAVERDQQTSKAGGAAFLQRVEALKQRHGGGAENFEPAHLDFVPIEPFGRKRAGRG